MKRILLILIILSGSLIYAQKYGEITGTVIDKSDGERLANADVFIVGTHYSTRTTSDGEFILKKIPVGTCNLKVTFIGYKSLVLENVIVKAEENKNLLIKLSKDTGKRNGVLDSAAIYFKFLESFWSKNKNITQKDIIIEYKDNANNYTVTGKDFFVDNFLAQMHTIRYKTSRKDSFYISFKFNNNGKIISSGNLKLPLTKNWCWGIDFRVDSKNPFFNCMGCKGYKVFPIDDNYKVSKTDSLYVIWGGNYIANPVVY